jgi:hypothetical protein
MEIVSGTVRQLSGCVYFINENNKNLPDKLPDKEYIQPDKLPDKPESCPAIVRLIR